MSTGRNSLELVERLDDALFQRIADWHSPIGDRTMPPLSEAASYSRIWMGVTALLVLLGGRRGRRTAIEALVAVGITSALANLAIKGIAKRQRPVSEVPDARRLRQPDSSSFSSGHTASAVGSRYPPLWLPINTLAAAVGFSRIYTGVHYPGDVLAGWILGKAVALGVHRISLRIETRRQ